MWCVGDTDFEFIFLNNKNNKVEAPCFSNARISYFRIFFDQKLVLRIAENLLFSFIGNIDVSFLRTWCTSTKLTVTAINGITLMEANSTLETWAATLTHCSCLCRVVKSDIVHNARIVFGGYLRKDSTL